MYVLRDCSRVTTVCTLRILVYYSSVHSSCHQDTEQCGQVMAGGDNMRIQPGQTHQIGVSRTQDDAMVGYVFQRPTEPEFNTQSSTFQAKQTPRAWALADDVIVDVCVMNYDLCVVDYLSLSLVSLFSSLWLGARTEKSVLRANARNSRSTRVPCFPRGTIKVATIEMWKVVSDR